VKISATRIAKYVRMMHAIADHHDKGAMDVLIAKYKNEVLINILAETNAVITIFEGLRNSADADLKRRLTAFVAGRDVLSAETAQGNNFARNVGFELEVAAGFARPGLPINLEGNGDLSVTVGEDTLAVECKRPFSYGKLEANLKDACRQLVLRYDSNAEPQKARGLAAISISKMENDGRQILRAPRESDINMIVENAFDSCIRRYHPLWGNINDSRTVAISLHLNAPAMVEDLNLLTMVRYFTFVSLADPSSSDASLTTELANRLEI